MSSPKTKKPYNIDADTRNADWLRILSRRAQPQPPQKEHPNGRQSQQ